jgi:hypothetical protein
MDAAASGDAAMRKRAELTRRPIVSSPIFEVLRLGLYRTRECRVAGSILRLRGEGV